MKLTVGTFNLNNLFSRWNFAAEIAAIPETPAVASEVEYVFGVDDAIKLRTYRGRLVKAKDAAGTEAIGFGFEPLEGAA